MTTALIKNDIYVKKSPVHGYGVFAGKDIESNEVLEECYSLILSKRNAHVLANYFFEWENGASMPLGYGCLYNHSKYPNAMYIYDLDRSIITFTSMRAIKKDEEIFIDYIEEWFSSRRIRVKRSWRYHWKQLLPTAFFILRFGLVAGLVYTFLHVSFF